MIVREDAYLALHKAPLNTLTLTINVGRRNAVEYTSILIQTGCRLSNEYQT